MNPALLAVFGLASLTMPVALSYSQEGNSGNTCGSKITQIEDQVQAAVGSSRVVHFIESNTTAFKSLELKYTLYWLNTTYSWNSDISNCSAKLEGITVTFQLSNSTVPFIGVAHIFVSPRLNSVTGVQVEIPNHIEPEK